MSSDNFHGVSQVAQPQLLEKNGVLELIHRPHDLSTYGIGVSWWPTCDDYEATIDLVPFWKGLRAGIGVSAIAPSCREWDNLSR